MLDKAVNHGAVYDGQITAVLCLLAKVEGGMYHCHVYSQNSVIFALRQKTSESLFVGLYLKIRTYLRVAQKAFLPTCQELLEVSLYTSETAIFVFKRTTSSYVSSNAWQVGKKTLFEPPSSKF